MSKTALGSSATSPSLKTGDVRSPSLSRSSASRKNSASRKGSHPGAIVIDIPEVSRGSGVFVAWPDQGGSRPASGSGSRPGTVDKQRAGRPAKLARSSSAGAGAGSGAGARVRCTSTGRLRPQAASPASTSKTPGGVLAGLAPATRQENQKADKFEEVYQRVKGSSEVSQASAKQATPTGAGAAQVGEALGLQGMDFEEDLKHFEGLLEELGKSIRMEGLLEVVAQNDQKEEEIKRQRERERKARDAARERQAASSPQRRIALRLDRCREVGMAEQVEIGGNSGIPLKKHLILSGHSPERLEIVNVPILQKRCLGLAADGSSTSFKALCKYAELEEKRQQWEANAYTQMETRHDYVRENLLSDSVRSRTWDSVNEKISQQEQRSKARHREAEVRRNEAMRERHRRKNTCKGPVRSASELQSPHLSDISPRLGGSFLCTKDEPQLLRNRSSQRFSVMSFKGRGSYSKFGHDLASPKNQKYARRGLFWWRVVRGVFRALWLLRLVRTRYWAVDVVRTLIRTVDQMGTIRKASRRLRVSVIKLQQALRGFLIRKRRWCDATAKLWSQYEDQYLERYFKANQRPEDAQIVFDKLQAVKGSRRRRSSFVFETSVFDWRIYRVPAVQRRFTLGRWYILQVRHWVEKRELFVHIVKRAMQHQLDMANYMKLCGIDPKTISEKQRSKKEPDAEAALPHLPLDASMSLSEPEAIELIRLAASELSHTAPFGDHPVNRGDTAKPPARISGHLRRILQKRNKLSSSKQKVEVGRKHFSIDTMEQAEFNSEAVGDRRTSLGVVVDDNLFNECASSVQMQPIA